MKTIYFECGMGAAGDMLMAALLELHDNPGQFLARLNNAGIPDVRVTAAPSVKHGITGTHISVSINGEEEHSHDHNHGHDHGHEHSHDHGHEHNHGHSHEHGNEEHTHEREHSHSDLGSIEHRIGHLNVSAAVKENAAGVYRLIAEAEGHAHGMPVSKVHFHEVGEMDAVADIVGVCMLIEELAPDLILVSPVHVGSGQVKCAHGILPVPAPATAYILRGAPIYGGNIRGELCTPTGAAILKYFAKDFGAMPVMQVSKIGYGMGRKDFEQANCVRAFIGQTAPAADGEVAELICNLDDMTPEAVAFAQQLLLDEGALDVWTAPIGMKKGRPGLMLACMCRHELKDKMLRLMFRHTSTLGIRENICRRYALEREFGEAQTQYGAVRLKTSRGYGVTKRKPEYEDIAKIARERGVPLSELNLGDGL